MWDVLIYKSLQKLSLTGSFCHSSSQTNFFFMVLTMSVRLSSSPWEETARSGNFRNFQMETSFFPGQADSVGSTMPQLRGCSAVSPVWKSPPWVVQLRAVSAGTDLVPSCVFYNTIAFYSSVCLATPAVLLKAWQRKWAVPSRFLGCMIPEYSVTNSLQDAACFPLDPKSLY